MLLGEMVSDHGVDLVACVEWYGSTEEATGIRRFAYYLSESAEVAGITERMWRTIDW